MSHKIGDGQNDPFDFVDPLDFNDLRPRIPQAPIPIHDVVRAINSLLAGHPRLENGRVTSHHVGRFKISRPPQKGEELTEREPHFVHHYWFEMSPRIPREMARPSTLPEIPGRAQFRIREGTARRPVTAFYAIWLSPHSDETAYLHRGLQTYLASFPFISTVQSAGCVIPALR